MVTMMAMATLLLLAPIVAQAEGQKAILVLDASGSMWGQIDGKAKISIAREVIADVLGGWNPENEIGLVTYGHRKKGDCSDIEALVPVGKLDAGKFNKAVTDLNPKGKTPMTEAVRQAAQLLRYTEEKATVILVSDGKETCAADPCAVAAELEKSGVDFTAHVIGFNVDEKEGISQLQCMANNTGGEFLTASNASDLKLALGKAVEKVAKPDPNAPVNLRISAVLAAGGEKVGGNWFEVHREQLDASIGKPKRIKVDTSGYYAEATFKVPPGDYIVTASQGKAYAEERITVEPGKGKDVELNLNAGRIKTEATLVAGGDRIGGNWFEVHREGTDEFGKPRRIKVDTTGYYAEGNFTVPAGDYIVTASQGKAYAEEKVTVEAGKAVAVTVNLNAGRIKTEATLVAGGDRIGGNWFEVHREGTDEFGKPSRIKVDTTGYYAEGNFTVPAGDYIVTASQGKAHAEEKVTVEAGKAVTATVNLNAGRIKVGATLVAGGDRIGGNWFEVHREGTDEFGKPRRIKVDTTGYYAEGNFTVPAGDYIVTASQGKAYAEEKVTVEPGKGSEVVVNLNAGRLRSYTVMTAGGSKVGGSFFEVYREAADASGKAGLIKVDASGYYAETTFILPAGEYLATAGRDKLYAERRVVVEAGKGVEAELLLGLRVPEYAKRLGDGAWQTWNSNQGPMGLLSKADGKMVGFYNTGDQGRVLLDMKDNVATGYWIENNSKQRCEAERDGSFHWGRLHWEFNSDMSSFTGWWSYCEADKGEAWTGNR